MNRSDLNPALSTGLIASITRRYTVRPQVDLTPRRVTLIYLVFGFAALYVSDAVLPALLANPLLSQVQAVKGAVEVLLTGGLIYVLTRTSRASLQQTNEQLEAARSELQVLHRVLRHNLRNNLTVIMGYADQLEGELTATDSEAYCDAIRATCREFTESIEKTKHLSELHANGLKPSEQDMAVALSFIERDVNQQYPNAELDVDFPESATVVAHKHIDFALEELIDNALAHDSAATPQVVVTAEQLPNAGGQMRIHVADSGPGIPADELEALRQQEEKPLLHGSGVGLWVARWIVLQSGGTFDIMNTEGGCQVTVTLPTPPSTAVEEAEAAFAALVE